MSLTRSLFLASLSLPASCVAPPRGVRPLSLAPALSFFGRHAEGKVRRRPPEPPAPAGPVRPPARPLARPGHGPPTGWACRGPRQAPRPPLRPEPAVSGPVAWLRGRLLGEGPPDSLVLGGSPAYSSSLRGSELGVFPVPDSILSPGGGYIPCPLWIGTRILTQAESWGFGSAFAPSFCGGLLRMGSSCAHFFGGRYFLVTPLEGRQGRGASPALLMKALDLFWKPWFFFSASPSLLVGR